jgi:predicted regulator of Ras-like GTPase activity (Roadblock/LC7/MglB family)
MPMFASKLEDAVRSVPGASAIVVMGFDGIPLESYGEPPNLEIETVGMEFSVVMREVRKAAEQLEAGSAEEISLRTDQLAVLLRIISDEYFVALIVDRAGNTGKGRYVLRTLAPTLRAELF